MTKNREKTHCNAKYSKFLLHDGEKNFAPPAFRPFPAALRPKNLVRFGKKL
jgi:hypothetical protein